MKGLDSSRFWAKVQKSEGCWLWEGTINGNGYGHLKISGRTILAHRVAYLLTYGPIPDGLVIDHVKDRGCSHRHCVNPSHLEAVPPRVNTLRGEGAAAKNARKTHCKNGHELSGPNLAMVNTGRGRIGRRCRTCRRAQKRAQKRRKTS